MNDQSPSPVTDTPIAPTSRPAPESQIAIDAANVIHAAERDTRHGLSHLEDEFLDYWRKMATFSETEAKKLLEWVAAKLP